MLHLRYALLATARSSLKPQRELALQNLAWHRKGFKLYWIWKSRNRGGLPPIDGALSTIEARSNASWTSLLLLTVDSVEKGPEPQALEARNQGCVSDQATQH
jgi:hypothetical protein